jgi:hypothetical protein
MVINLKKATMSAGPVEAEQIHQAVATVYGELARSVRLSVLSMI